MLIIVFFLCFQETQALDINITEKEIEGSLRMGHNKSFNFHHDISATALVELNGQYALKGGFSTGNLDRAAAIKAFTGLQFFPLKEKRLFNISTIFIYNGLPNYETHSFTILPFVSVSGKIAGISLGPSLCFTSFFGEKAQFESILSFSAYVNFINREKFRIGVTLSNFNEFEAEKFGAFRLALTSAYRINKQWGIFNDLEFMQRGIDGLSAVFFGFAWRGGAKFSW